MGKVILSSRDFHAGSLIHYFSVFFLSLMAAVAVSLFQQRFQSSPGRLGNRKSGKGRAWIELDREALRKNVAYLRSKLPKGCELMPAVKAEAYGHGAVLMAKELNRMGVKAFCVACAREGAELRKHGIKGEILILGYTHPGEFGLLVRYGLTQTVIDFSYGACLNRYGRKIHRKIRVHVGIDTGMHRLGERSENKDRISGIFSMEHLKIDGIFTHLCAADVQKEPERTFTWKQIRDFYQVAEYLEERTRKGLKMHIQSSYGVINYPQAGGDYARVGIALYGVLSRKEDMEKSAGELAPVLSLKARVALVKNLYRGESAGYGMDFRTDRNRKIAVITAGYGDGIPRSLSERGGQVLIHGYRVPVIGRICMDQMMVDVTGAAEVKAGDEAVLIGRSGKEEISACDLAEQAGTITNEILSRLGARLERMVL